MPALTYGQLERKINKVVGEFFDQRDKLLSGGKTPTHDGLLAIYLSPKNYETLHDGKSDPAVWYSYNGVRYAVHPDCTLDDDTIYLLPKVRLQDFGPLPPPPDGPRVRPFGVTVEKQRWKTMIGLSRMFNPPSDLKKRMFNTRVLSPTELAAHFDKPQRLLRIYVAGPMSHHPNYNFKAFGKTVTALRECGFNLIHDPREHVGNEHAEYMWHSIAEILHATDVVVVMPGWEKS